MSALLADHFIERAEHHLRYGELNMARVALEEARAALKHVSIFDEGAVRAELTTRWYAVDEALAKGRR